jgi:subtilisin
LQILDPIAENGAKLVKVYARDMADLRMAQPGLRFAPVLENELPWLPRMLRLETLAASPAGVAGVDFTVTSATGNSRRPRGGIHGRVRLQLPSSTRSLERIYVYPKSGFWPKLLKNVAVKKLSNVEIDAIVLPPTDLLRAVYGNEAADSDGKGVVVGVVDTGCGPHPDLTVAGGYSTVGADPNDFLDNGEQHGTHVAGIIAAHGEPTKGVALVRNRQASSRIFAPCPARLSSIRRTKCS